MHVMEIPGSPRGVQAPLTPEAIPTAPGRVVAGRQAHEEEQSSLEGPLV